MSTGSTAADGPGSAPARPLRLCPGCGATDREFGPGPGGRPGARCRKCGSLERHRFLTALLDGLRGRVEQRLVVDIAPSRHVDAVLARLAPARHIRVDLDPTADGRAVDIRASLTALPFPDGTVDTLICYHVLEHVPDDATAMREIARVLRDDGMGLIQVPFRPAARTDEDPDAEPAERIRRFGQADHVRYYGTDFEDRLGAAGLGLTRIDPTDVLGEELGAAMNVGAKEFVWVVWPKERGAAPAELADLPRSVLSQLVLTWSNHAAVSRRRLNKARKRAAGLERRSARAQARSTSARGGPLPRALRRRVGRVLRGVRRRLPARS